MREKLPFIKIINHGEHSEFEVNKNYFSAMDWQKTNYKKLYKIYLNLLNKK